MYYLYHKHQSGRQTVYSRAGTISLFGCNVGLIPRALKAMLAQSPPSPGPDVPWHLDLGCQHDARGEAIVIDARPPKRNGKPTESSLLFFELRDVWGYSNDVWTPIMLRLVTLLKDADRATTMVDPLSVELPSGLETAYTFLYLRGGIASGQPVGTWNPGNASTTNSVFLFDAARRYFCQSFCPKGKQRMRRRQTGTEPASLLCHRAASARIG